MLQARREMKKPCPRRLRQVKPVVCDVHAKPAAPLTNVTPTSDNGAHGAIHSLPKLQQQMQGFLANGMIVDTCGGVCSF